MRTLRPNWVRPWDGNNVIRLRDCGGRSELIQTMPAELRSCLALGSDTTLMVWADCDHDMPDGDALRSKFWEAACHAGISREDFDTVVFVFAKDRLENWIEFLNTGTTNENAEGPRIQHLREAADAAKSLATRCQGGDSGPLPPSLNWSCENWRSLTKRKR